MVPRLSGIIVAEAECISGVPIDAIRSLSKSVPIGLRMDRRPLGSWEDSFVNKGYLFAFILSVTVVFGQSNANCHAQVHNVTHNLRGFSRGTVNTSEATLTAVLWWCSPSLGLGLLRDILCSKVSVHGWNGYMGFYGVLWRISRGRREPSIWSSPSLFSVSVVLEKSVRSDNQLSSLMVFTACIKFSRWINMWNRK